MKRLFSAVARKQAREQQKLLEGWEKTNPPRALLEYAAQDNLEKIDALLAAGVDPNAEVQIDITVDTIMETPLSAAASAGKLRAAQRLIAAGARVDKPVDDNYTPLMKAAVEGWPLMVEYLASQGADIHVREDIFGHTPLHKAARLGRAVAVETLLALGADRLRQDHAGRIAEDTICQQYGGSAADKDELGRAIRKAFDDDTARKAEAAARIEAAHAARAREMAEAAELQRDMQVRSVATIRPRGPKP